MNELEILKSLEKHKDKMTPEQIANLEAAIKRAELVIDQTKK